MSNRLFFLLIFIAASLMAYAQTPPAAVNDTVMLEEVVVTASKVPLPLRETAKPVLILRREDIAARPARDLAQLLDDMVGVVVNGAQSNPGLNKGLYLRGAGSAYTLILIDGQPIADPSGVGGPVDLRLFPLHLIERIEVLKGSQSTLYGTDAIAGVVNIITRQQTEKPFSLAGALSYGSYGTWDASAGIQGKTGILDYQMAYQRFSTNGISEALDTTGTGSFDRDGLTQQGFQAKAGLQLGRHVRIAPFFRWSDYAGDTDADAFTDAENQYSASFIQPGLDARLDFGKLSAQLYYGYNQTRRNFSSSFGDFPFEGRFQHAEALLSYKLGDYVQILGGFNTQQHQLLDSSTTAINPQISINSPFATVLIRNAHGFSLEAGYRMNSHSTFGNQSVLSLAPAYQLTPAFRAFASYTTGFKAPTLYELYGAFGGNTELSPQRSASWEAGIQLIPPQGKLETRATFFNRRISDIILYNFSSGYFNQDRQDDYGVEWEGRWAVSSKVTFAAQYAFTDGKITTKDAQERDTSFFNLIRRPKHRAGLTLDYHPISRLSFLLQGQYNGQRSDIFFNPARFYAQEEVRLAPYFLLHLSARYEMIPGKASVFADLRNLTNTALSEVYGYSTMGLNAYGGVRFSL